MAVNGFQEAPDGAGKNGGAQRQRQARMTATATITSTETTTTKTAEFPEAAPQPVSSGKPVVSPQLASRVAPHVAPQDRSQRAWTGAETLVVATWAPIAALGMRDDLTPPTIGKPVYLYNEHNELVLDRDGRPIEVCPKQNPGGLIASRLYPIIIETLSRKAPVISLCANNVDNLIERLYADTGRTFPFTGVDQGHPLARPMQCRYLGGERLPVSTINLAKSRFADEVIWYSAHLEPDEITKKELAYSPDEARTTFLAFLKAQKAMGDFIIDSSKDYKEVDANKGRVVAMIEDFQLSGTAFATLAAWIEAGRDPKDLDMRHFWHIPETNINSMRAMGLPEEMVHDFFLLRAFNQTSGSHTDAYRDEFLQSLRELNINFSDLESIRFHSEECREVFGDESLKSAAFVMREKLRTLTPGRERTVMEITARHLRNHTHELPESVATRIAQEGLSRVITPAEVVDHRVATSLKAVLPDIVDGLIEEVDRVLGEPRTHTDSVKIDLDARAKLMASPEVEEQARLVYQSLFQTPLATAGVHPHRFPVPEDAKFGIDLDEPTRADVMGYVGRDDFKNGNSTMEIAYFFECHAFNEKLRKRLGREVSQSDLQNIDVLLENTGLTKEDLPPFLISGTARAREAKVAYGDVATNKQNMAARDAFVIESVKRQLLDAKVQYDKNAISLERFDAAMENAAKDAATTWHRAAYATTLAGSTETFADADYRQINELADSLPSDVSTAHVREVVAETFQVPKQTEYDRVFWLKRGVQSAIESLPMHGLAPMKGNLGPGVNTVYDVALMGTTIGGRELIGAEAFITSMSTRVRSLVATDGAPMIPDTMMCIDEQATGLGAQWPEFDRSGNRTFVTLPRLSIPKGTRWTMLSPSLKDKPHMIPGAIVLTDMKKVPPVTRALRFQEAAIAAAHMSLEERTIRDRAMRYMVTFEQGVLQSLYENSATRGRVFQEGWLSSFRGTCTSSRVRHAERPSAFGLPAPQEPLVSLDDASAFTAHQEPALLQSAAQEPAGAELALT